MEEILERLFEKFNQEKKLLEEIPLTERWADGKPKLFPEEITNIIKKYDNAHDQIYLFSMRIIYELRPDFKILKLSLIASFTRYTEKFLDKLMSDRHGVSLEQSANLDNFKSRLGTVDYDYLLGLTKSSEEKIFYYENCVSRFASICREITTLLCQLERFEDIKEFAELSVQLEINEDINYHLSSNNEVFALHLIQIYQEAIFNVSKMGNNKEMEH